jgi:hypothetical protein
MVNLLQARPERRRPGPRVTQAGLGALRGCGWFLLFEPAGQFVKVLRLGRFSGHRPERLDRQAELLQVGTTAGASLAVGHETDSVPFR